MSFNARIVSAIIGSGAAASGNDAVSAREILVIVGAWVSTFALGYGTMAALPGV